eukprot:TRINITY_DN6420_c0_g2_i1.p1 TRINITY_DN6420_c0_g2~~TRINITY_DN6420_c0_g2_i1.p1  ORF type:complete len:306 (-),score=70.55 TRINITY_DN6420_c0_g2_i1:549-1466(-)
MQGGENRKQTHPGGKTTIDLFSWSESSPETPKSDNGAPNGRSRVPAGGKSSISFTEQVTPEQMDSFKRRPCSDSKWKEMTGSGIFNDSNDGEDAANVNPSGDHHSNTRLHQQAAGIISQISFGTEESVSPKKPTSIPEVAKQKELSGNLETSSDIHFKRQVSEAKAKELSGHDIFGPPPDVPPRSYNRTIERKEEPVEEIREPSQQRKTSVKVSNPAGGPSNITFGEETPTKTIKKVHDQKVAELSGNNIFKGDAPPSSAEKPLSRAKLREMSGSDIFADGKLENREYYGGVRKPPGGGSSITLV